MKFYERREQDLVDWVKGNWHSRGCYFLVWAGARKNFKTIEEDYGDWLAVLVEKTLG